MSEASAPRVGLCRRPQPGAWTKFCDRFEAAWKAAGNAAQRTRIEQYLQDALETERCLRSPGPNLSSCVLVVPNRSDHSQFAPDGA
jgi:hypothetical protein